MLLVGCRDAKGIGYVQAQVQGGCACCCSVLLGMCTYARMAQRAPWGAGRRAGPARALCNPPRAGAALLQHGPARGRFGGRGRPWWQLEKAAPTTPTQSGQGKYSAHIISTVRALRARGALRSKDAGRGGRRRRAVRGGPFGAFRQGCRNGRRGRMLLALARPFELSPRASQAPKPALPAAAGRHAARSPIQASASSSSASLPASWVSCGDGGRASRKKVMSEREHAGGRARGGRRGRGSCGAASGRAGGSDELSSRGAHPVPEVVDEAQGLVGRAGALKQRLGAVGVGQPGRVQYGRMGGRAAARLVAWQHRTRQPALERRQAGQLQQRPGAPELPGKTLPGAHGSCSEWKTSSGVATLPSRGASQSQAAMSCAPTPTRTG